MKETEEGLPWWPSGKDPVLPMQGAQVRSLVKELRSHISCGMAKKKKKRQWKDLHIQNLSRKCSKKEKREWVSFHFGDREDSKFLMYLSAELLTVFNPKMIPTTCVCMLSLHLCLTLCDPMDCSPPGSSIHGILQA